MIVSAIAAMAANRVIGTSGALPWKLPEEMRFFREKTKGHIMIMGRKTFESFGGPLPNRLHIVITRQPHFQANGASVAANVAAALDLARQHVSEWGDEVFVVGGGEIYREALPYTDRIYLTEIHRDFQGDAIFPEFSKTEFAEIERRKGREEVPYDFVTYERSRI